MCDQCGNDPKWESEPGTEDRMIEVDADEASKIITYGHVVRLVFPTEDDPDGHKFWYSCGRAAVGKEDYLVTGSLPPEVGQYMVNEAARMVDDGEIQVGQNFPPDTLLSGYPVRVVPVPDLEEAEMYGALKYATDHEAVAYQLVWPDKDGKFPGEGFDTRYNQPVFG